VICGKLFLFPLLLALLLALPLALLLAVHITSSRHVALGGLLGGSRGYAGLAFLVQRILASVRSFFVRLGRRSQPVSILGIRGDPTSISVQIRWPTSH